MKMEWGKEIRTYEEAVCRNELVDMLERAINAGIITLEKADTLPRRVENLSRERLPVCNKCGNADLKKLAVVYYDRVVRGFWSIGHSGTAVTQDDFDTNSVTDKDPWAPQAAGYFIACRECGDEHKYDGEIEF